MQVNSNTLVLGSSSNEYKELEGVLKKIASDAKVDNIKSATLTVSSDSCTVMFKRANETSFIDKEMPLAQLQQEYKFVSTSSSLEDSEVPVANVAVGDTVYAWSDESGQNVDKIKVV